MRARYTEYLRDLMLNEQVKPLLEKALSTYPLYTPPKGYDLIPTREELNTKILNHYKYREIGFETVGRFLDELEITMCEIMPHYNELFKTVEIMAELPSPFDNVDVTETFTQTQTGTTTHNTKGSDSGTANTTGSTKSLGESTSENSGTTSGNSTNESNGKSVSSQTPQNELSIGAENIDSLGYADNATWAKDKATNTTTGETTNTGSTTTESEGSSTSSSTTSSESESESSGTSESTVTHTMTKKGNQGVNTYAHDMIEFRKSIIDVVEQIVNDRRLGELFMLIW